MDTDVELIKGSGIIVNAWKLRSIKNTYSKNPKEMARKLMKMIIGVEQLKKSSPTGKNGRIPIPTDVFEEFVNDNVAKKKYQINDMKKIINVECEEVKPDKKNNKEEATASKEQDDFEQDLEELSDGDFEKDLEELSDGDFEKESTEIKKNKETKNDEKIEYDKKSEEKKKQKRPRKTHPPETLQTTNSTRVMREKNPKSNLQCRFAKATF
ncbi:protein PXR1-like isoform X2 [Nasonia vitripennis]|uniref:BEN domain-containing protein n=1 Tax=Nasonia vitripennis TaxID=7425 RepID=A0A7M7QMG8_NASVI|nr:protein PXR1-like isoform X2 [Nasonia vitripennis]